MIFRPLLPTDSSQLFHYFQNLSAHTQHRFSPHSFDLATVEAICYAQKDFRFVIENTENQQIIGYCIANRGFSENDKKRFLTNGVDLDDTQTCSFAPSVADDFQGMGLGQKLFDWMISELKKHKIKNLVLLGGVQQNNTKAVAYYQKLGFHTAGSFERDGAMNLSMWRKI